MAESEHYYTAHYYKAEELLDDYHYHRSMNDPAPEMGVAAAQVHATLALAAAVAALANDPDEADEA